MRASNQAGAELRRWGVRGGGNHMGTVISFPAVARAARGVRTGAQNSSAATVVILPVIRIERYTDEPTGDFQRDDGGSRRRRRRRANRS